MEKTVKTTSTSAEESFVKIKDYAKTRLMHFNVSADQGSKEDSVKSELANARLFDAKTEVYAEICPVAISSASVTEDSKEPSAKPKSTNVDTFDAKTEEDVKTYLVETLNVFASQDSVEDSVKLVSPKI